LADGTDRRAFYVVVLSGRLLAVCQNDMEEHNIFLF
jgi:hypothetical protein